MADPLDEYRERRRFAQTPEPDGGGDGGGARDQDGGGDGNGARFAVQEHHARRLHWDLRLERDGVLASWAIPNGLPPTPRDNRKAIRTEDHPLEYLTFEGEIPAGEYGAGRVVLWDSGAYELLKWTDEKVEVRLHGERLHGRYALFRAGGPRDWMIHRMDPPDDPGWESLPRELVPMLARAGELPDDERGWTFEVKWDGIRALVISAPGRLRAVSRRGRDLTATYPELRGLGRALGAHEVVLDGEIVAFDEQGRPSFERLQQRMNLASARAVERAARELPVTYAIFDLLHRDGRSLLALPWSERRAQLEALALDGPAWSTPATHPGEGRALLRAATAQQLEGIVAKRIDAHYEPGRRSGAWIKVKLLRRQEFVIGGWLPGEGRRHERIGALLLGVQDAGGLRYAGRVGTGFDEAMLTRLQRELAARERPTSPFASGAVPRGARFAEPELVAEVAFREWTRSGIVRNSSFAALRDDKDPRDVVREDDEGRGEDGERRRPHGGGARPRRSGDAGTTGADLAAATAPGAGGGRRVVRGGVEVDVEGRRLKLTNLDKPMYPAAGLAKREVIDYYAQIADVLLPHLRGRALTFVRYPDGVDGESFFQKRCPPHRPDWVQTAPVASRSARGGAYDACVCDDLPTLVWAANLAAIELHPGLARAERPQRPTAVVFDLDPGEGAGIVACCEVGLVLRGLFQQLGGLRSWAKTSGSKGLQVYVPLETETTYDATKAFAREVAATLATRLPELVVASQRRELRRGRVLIDWSQNDEHKTTVSVYSLRARERPTVSTPVTWEEVEACRAAGDEDGLRFEAADVLARVAREGDLFAPLLSCRQTLPGA